MLSKILIQLFALVKKDEKDRKINLREVKNFLDKIQSGEVNNVMQKKNAKKKLKKKQII